MYLLVALSCKMNKYIQEELFILAGVYPGEGSHSGTSSHPKCESSSMGDSRLTNKPENCHKACTFEHSFAINKTYLNN